jgi:hypothetical protein
MPPRIVSDATNEMNVAAVERRYVGRGQPVVAWLPIAAAALFALLWLSEIVPELLSGAPSLRSASHANRTEMGNAW